LPQNFTSGQRPFSRPPSPAPKYFPGKTGLRPNIRNIIGRYGATAFSRIDGSEMTK
jgi:hypothetical protein